MTTTTEHNPRPETVQERKRRHGRLSARLVRELAAAADGMPQVRVRDVVCGWLASRGLMRAVRESMHPYDVEDGPGGCAHDVDALDHCATLAHRDAGHPGHLDLCSEELCRALSDAGAD